MISCICVYVLMKIYNILFSTSLWKIGSNLNLSRLTENKSTVCLEQWSLGLRYSIKWTSWSASPPTVGHRSGSYVSQRKEVG